MSGAAGTRVGGCVRQCVGGESVCVVCLGAIFVCVCLGLVRQELGSCSEICAVCVSLSLLYLQDG